MFRHQTLSVGKALVFVQMSPLAVDTWKLFPQHTFRTTYINLTRWQSAGGERISSFNFRFAKLSCSYV